MARTSGLLGADTLRRLIAGASKMLNAKKGGLPLKERMRLAESVREWQEELRAVHAINKARRQAKASPTTEKHESAPLGGPRRQEL